MSNPSNLGFREALVERAFVILRSPLSGRARWGLFFLVVFVLTLGLHPLHVVYHATSDFWIHVVIEAGIAVLLFFAIKLLITNLFELSLLAFVLLDDLASLPAITVAHAFDVFSYIDLATSRLPFPDWGAKTVLLLFDAGILALGLSPLYFAYHTTSMFWMHVLIEAGIAVLLFFAVHLLLTQRRPWFWDAFLIILGVLILCSAANLEHIVHFDSHHRLEFWKILLIALGVSVFIAVLVENYVKWMRHAIVEWAKAQESTEITQTKGSGIGSIPPAELAFEDGFPDETEADK